MWLTNNNNFDENERSFRGLREGKVLGELTKMINLVGNKSLMDIEVM